jgi:hypothetical protein
MLSRTTVLTWIGIVLLSGVFLTLLMGQICAAQTDPCSPPADPCSGIENAVGGSCHHPIPGGICNPPDFTCACDPGYTWQHTTNTCEEPLPIVGKIVFLTESEPDGNMGGIIGADMICQGEADAAGLTGVYKAWLSDSNPANSPASRFTHSTGPYVRVDGTIVAQDWTDLTDGSILDEIVIAADGTNMHWTDPDGLEHVWTNTRVDGTRAGAGLPSSACNDFTSADEFLGPVTTGHAFTFDGWDAPEDWTEGGTYSCNAHNFLYCFQQ